MAEDSGRLREECAPAHTGSGRRLSATSYRVAKRSSDRSSARPPCPQMPQWHPRVAKRASIGTLARGPSTEALLGQGRVPKGRKSVPLTGLWSGSRPGSARHPRLQVVLRQGRVAKRVFYQRFGTATLPTGTSEPSPRGEGVIYRLFGTATLPTEVSVASRRGEEGFCKGEGGGIGQY